MSIPVSFSNQAIRLKDKTPKRKIPGNIWWRSTIMRIRTSSKSHMLEHWHIFLVAPSPMLTFLWSVVCWLPRGSDQSNNSSIDSLYEPERSNYWSYLQLYSNWFIGLQYKLWFADTTIEILLKYWHTVIQLLLRIIREWVSLTKNGNTDINLRLTTNECTRY